MMSKVRTAFRLISRPKEFALVMKEKFDSQKNRLKDKADKHFRRQYYGWLNFSNFIFNRNSRRRLAENKKTVMLVAPYVGIPRTMAVTNYMNCWLQGFRRLNLDAFLLSTSQKSKPLILPDNLKGELLLAEFKEPNFSFEEIVKNEKPDFAIFHNSIPPVQCAASSKIKIENRYLFVGDVMTGRVGGPGETKKYIKKILNEFGGLIVVSSYLRDEWVKYGFGKDAIYVTRTPVDVEAWPNHCGSHSQMVAGYFGNIYHKEIDNLLEISKIVHEALPKFKLHIYGDGDLDDWNDLFNKILSNKQSRYVILHKSVSIEKMRIIQSKMDVLLLPREKGEFSDGGFPNKIGEYLASGCPLVCTDVGEISQVLTAGLNSRIVEPGNIRVFAEEVTNCLINRNASLVIAQKGKEFIKAYSSPENVAEGFMQWRTSRMNMLKSSGYIKE